MKTENKVEILYTPLRNIANYVNSIIDKNSGMNIVFLDNRADEYIQSHWRKSNPLLTELHLNKGIIPDWSPQSDEPGLKFFKETSADDLLEKLVALSVIPHIGEKLELNDFFADFLRTRLKNQISINGAVTAENIFSWRKELESAPENYEKVLPLMNRLCNVIYNVLLHVDKKSIFDVAEVLKKERTLYMSPGTMCKDRTSLVIRSLFLIDILKWVRLEMDKSSDNSETYIIITEPLLYSPNVLNDLKSIAVQKGMQLVLAK